jgi:hypothetical protein
VRWLSNYFEAAWVLSKTGHASVMFIVVIVVQRDDRRRSESFSLIGQLYILYRPMFWMFSPISLSVLVVGCSKI